ncbi:MAG: hypothetical protein HQL40_12685 [Alphaproteobacteria bacterium]|nr:hypothetical protein [Alphaproteobacteria bacterium]
MASERERGFGIAQIAVVAVVVGMMVGATAILRIATQGREAQATATSRMQEIAEAINAFALSQGRLPCPAPHTAAAVETTYKEDSTCGYLDGLVPWQSLGLTESMAFDPWGRRISYRVDDGLAAAGTPIKSLKGAYAGSGLTVCLNAACTSVYRSRNYSTGGATFALISHGPSGIGARLRPFSGGYAQQARAGGTAAPGSVEEQANVAAPNADFQIFALPASAPSVTPADATHFDDVVVLGTTVKELAKYISGIEDRAKPKGADPALSDLTKFRIFTSTDDPASVATSKIDTTVKEMPLGQLDTGNTTEAVATAQRSCHWGPDTVQLSAMTIRAFLNVTFEDDSGSGNQANADRRGDGLILAFLPQTAAATQADLPCGDGAYMGFSGPLGTEMPTPRFGIEIDTRHNSTHNDPTEARNHLAILRNGISHDGTSDAGPMCSVVSGGTLDSDYATKGHHACASERQTMRVLSGATSTTLSVPGDRTAQFGTNSLALVRRSTGNDLSSTGTSHYTLSGSAVGGNDTDLTVTGMTVPDTTDEDGVVIGSSFLIVGVSVGSGTFTVDGDHRADFPTGSQAFVNNSTANNGYYTVTGTAYDAASTATTITVSETIASATADGRVTAMVRNWMAAGLGTFPATITAGDASFTVAGDRTAEFPGGATAYAGGAVNKVASSAYAAPNTTVTLSGTAAASATAVSGAPRYWLESGRHQSTLAAVDTGGYTVTAVTRGPSFTVSGDRTGVFTAGASAVVSGSTGNDATYAVRASAVTGGNTIIYVERDPDITTEPDDATANGTITVGVNGYPITAVQTHGTLTVAGDHVIRYSVDNAATLSGTDNAGEYTVASSTLIGGDTVVAVKEPLPTSTIGGTLTGLAQFQITGNQLSLFRSNQLVRVTNSSATPTALDGAYWIVDSSYDGATTYIYTSDTPPTTSVGGPARIAGSGHKLRVEIHSGTALAPASGCDLANPVMVKAWLWDARVPWSLCKGGLVYCDDLESDFVSDGNESAHVWHCVPYDAVNQDRLWFGIVYGVSSGAYRAAPEYDYFGIGAY